MDKKKIYQSKANKHEAKMTKKYLIMQVNKKWEINLNYLESRAAVDEVFDIIMEEVINGGTFVDPKLGKFHLSYMSSKRTRHVMTMEEQFIEGREIFKYKPSKYLEEVLNGKNDKDK